MHCESYDRPSLSLPTVSLERNPSTSVNYPESINFPSAHVLSVISTSTFFFLVSFIYDPSANAMLRARVLMSFADVHASACSGFSPRPLPAGSSFSGVCPYRVCRAIVVSECGNFSTLPSTHSSRCTLAGYFATVPHHCLVSFLFETIPSVSLISSIVRRFLPVVNTRRGSRIRQSRVPDESLSGGVRRNGSARR